MKAKLIIPKGFRVVKRPNFNNKVLVLMTTIDDVPKMYWKDATYEHEPFELCLYVFIEKKVGEQK